MSPILHRELVDLLRQRSALALVIALAAACALLVLIRWPTEGVSDLNGARSMQVLRVFGYGLLAGVLFLVPAFPATAIVRERVQGTLALLLNSPLSPRAIYLGKLGGILGFAAILLLVTTPAAAACYALGGVSARGGVGLLYLVLAVAAVQFTTLGLWISGRAIAADAALRATYGAVLAVAVLPLIPHWLLQGTSGVGADVAGFVRNVSPVPTTMEILGHSALGDRGFGSSTGSVTIYLVLALASSFVFGLLTIQQLVGNPLDRARPAGVMTEDRSRQGRKARRFFFLVDPQKRSGSASLLFNPVLVKELRSRRFGRFHWIVRRFALCAIGSLGLSIVATSGALAWGSGAIGAAIVLLQTVLILLFVPSLASGVVSSEIEGKTWNLLRTTPLSAGRILRGKLLAVAWPILLLAVGTLPGYLVMATIEPEQFDRMQTPVLCLGMTALFAVLASATASSLFRSTAVATAAAYAIVLGVCLAPFLIWFGRDAPFGQSIVEGALRISPVAGALASADLPGFAGYDLLPMNWWIIGAACGVLMMILVLRTRQLYRPE